MIFMPMAFISFNEINVSLRFTVLVNKLATSYMW